MRCFSRDAGGLPAIHHCLHHTQENSERQQRNFENPSFPPLENGRYCASNLGQSLREKDGGAGTSCLTSAGFLGARAASRNPKNILSLRF